jgi:hypothetical protein
MMHGTTRFLGRGRSWPQPVDQAQNFFEQIAWYGDLRHLERDIARMGDDPGTDLDELLAQAGQRPVCDSFGQRERPQEVGKIVGERMKLNPHSIGGERAACLNRHETLCNHNLIQGMRVNHD